MSRIRPRLIHLNGPSSIGKSTLARRFVDDHPLALNLDIDVLRSWLGRWESRDEAKQIARDLAKGIAAAHLRSGYDVILPQLILRPTEIDGFSDVAIGAGGSFLEVILLGAEDTSLERFMRRRNELAASGTKHPEASVPEGMEAEMLRHCYAGLKQIAADRPSARVVDVQDGDIEATYATLTRVIEDG